MKVLILAGGLGTRLSEETDIRPKPMVEIGGRPIIWHIMKIYSHYGYNDFVILLGYKGYTIKEYFANYYLHQSDITFNLQNEEIQIHNTNSEPWKVTLIETGENSMTGGRIKRAKEYINNETFMLTYGDGLSNINISEQYKFHKENGKKITMTAVQPEGKFGALTLEENIVTKFIEKPIESDNWVNGGFFICEPEVLDYIDNDSTIFEKEPLARLVKDKELIAYKHSGFWKCMDTLRDKISLNELWNKNKAKWKIW